MKQGHRTSVKSMLRMRRHTRVRAKVKGTGQRPRLSVFRSAKWIYGQIIDDVAGVTLCAVRGNEVGKVVHGERKASVARAYEAGKLISQKAQQKNVTRVVFDRGGYAYKGRIKAFADGARDSGLKF